jgi:rod shape-determining protein MreD
VNNTLNNISRFIILLVLQIVIFNNINFYGFLNPYPYVLFILLFPINGNRLSLLITSFSIGLILDMFLNSGGIHATASLCLAYIRPTLFKFSFGLSYEYQTIKIADKITSERVVFLLLSIIIHHFILFLFEFYRLSLLPTVLFRTLATTILTFLVCVLIIYLIKPRKR